ncbi:hypothetical protein DRW07_07790 [Alteromonas sediminis]|uniref:Uncharacterized protein n=1 Tax=Alteromonas sediminis TaxID=2259342 RepID=A0A3N5Y3K7_9ALTE|nr:hypothetical protein [Alteromonas sediminis]RPJ67416.1 hypothetical protein DRW07_07790 [Alteromonas sediminis]
MSMIFLGLVVSGCSERVEPLNQSELGFYRACIKGSERLANEIGTQYNAKATNTKCDCQARALSAILSDEELSEAAVAMNDHSLNAFTDYVSQFPVSTQQDITEVKLRCG